MADHMEPPAPAGQGGSVMEKAIFAAAPLFGEVVVRLTHQKEITEIPENFYLSPEQAKALSKALAKAARAAEKTEA